MFALSLAPPFPAWYVVLIFRQRNHQDLPVADLPLSIGQFIPRTGHRD
jgi:hypothetical protein